MPRFGQRHIYLMAVHWTIMLISELIQYLTCLLFSQLLYFTHNAREWLDRDSKNVIAVHCKGGKGRNK